jgi:hypothetical protein
MRGLLVVAGLVCWAGAAAAQDRPPADQLRQQVVQRFMENYRSQSDLTDEQFGQVQTILRRSWETRQSFQQRERMLLRGLERQMRPGVAADADSLSRQLDDLLRVQTERVEFLRGEQAALAQVLTPLQRAQLVLALTRLENQIETIRMRRDGMGAGQRRFPPR